MSCRSLLKNLIAVMALFLSTIAQGNQVSSNLDDENVSKEVKNEAAKVNNCARIGSIYQYFLNQKPENITDPTSYSAYKMALDILEGIAENTRADQTKMRDLALAIESYIYTIPETEKTRPFKDKVLLKTKDIKFHSRRDTFFMNQNISRLTRCEGPILLEEISRLSEKYKSSDTQEHELSDRMNIFKSDLTELSSKYINTRKFYAGVGMSYAYIPQIFLRSNYNLDFTMFDPTLGNDGNSGLVDSGTQFIDSNFSNFGYPALRFTVDIPYISVDLMLSNKDVSVVDSSAVASQNTGLESEAILFKTDINSTLSLDYDAQVRLSLKDLTAEFDTHFRPNRGNGSVTDKFVNKLLSQIDFGLGVGLTGFGIKNRISTDFRLKRSNDFNFNELETLEIRHQSSRNSFRVSYWNAFATFEVSDQIMASLEYRFYDNIRKDRESLGIEGNTLTFSFIYFVL